jgi:hypothetical protein
MNGLRKCCTYTQWNLFSHIEKCMELESIILSEGQKSRFPSYADYRPKTNEVILLNMGHTLRGDHAREGQRK